MKIFDTHTHYDDAKFDALAPASERAGFVRTLMDENDICGIVGMGVDIKSSMAQLEYSKKIDCFYAACGFHPENIPSADIDSCMATLGGLLQDKKAVAVGEIGLDYYYEQNPPREVQIKWFERQMELAGGIDLPVVIHDREAHGDCFDIVCRHKNVRGVFHSFSGSAEMARQLISKNYMLSFTGVVTFKNAPRLCEVVKSIPIENIMLETDCPYMAPVPMRGKINHSGYLHYTAEKIAELKNMTPDEVAAITAENAIRFFNINNIK